MNTWGKLSFQDSSSPMMEQLIFFHDHMMMVLILIMGLVSYILLSIFINKNINRGLLEGQQIEIIWTILPAIILIFIALPSLRLLYLSDELKEAQYTLKVIGHQWYWVYEYLQEFKEETAMSSKESYMLKNNELFRLLETDNVLTLPCNMYMRAMITAADVLHAWSIPSLGIKIDAVPGRLNQVSFLVTRAGIFYGQCSEICGAQHSFMPIVLEVLSPSMFKMAFK
uniref:Cytochrome c oxidase subunit 2 n=1 Tax=Allobathynella sp. JHS-2017 TaxID=2025385 RepID=A0A7R6D7F2_9CRUS|nr:cytochrome oxidase subunit 2 [Allobathynella sp. JHS-2017]